mmetsp:Transcript_34315/g.100925  ORF Transcript_34315/g.100925 Transcript_34315/m.100925 type:complete len:257 (+) Transcript_34315:2874-3644(+)
MTNGMWSVTTTMPEWEIRGTISVHFMKGFVKTHGPTAIETLPLFLKSRRLLKQPSGGTTTLNSYQGRKRVILQMVMRRHTTEFACLRHFRCFRYRSTTTALWLALADHSQHILALSPMVCLADTLDANTRITSTHTGNHPKRMEEPDFVQRYALSASMVMTQDVAAGSMLERRSRRRVATHSMSLRRTHSPVVLRHKARRFHWSTPSPALMLARLLSIFFLKTSLFNCDQRIHRWQTKDFPFSSQHSLIVSAPTLW